MLVQLGDRQAGYEHLARAHELALSSGSSRDIFRYHGNFTDQLIGAGRFDEAITMAREGRQQTAERGVARTAGAFLAGNEAEASLLAGQWDAVLSHGGRGAGDGASADHPRSPASRCAPWFAPGAACCPRPPRMPMTRAGSWATAGSSPSTCFRWFRCRPRSPWGG